MHPNNTFNVGVGNKLTLKHNLIERDKIDFIGLLRSLKCFAKYVNFACLKNIYKLYLKY